MMIVDAHLDLAYNAVHGREVAWPAARQTAAAGDGVPSVGLPDLAAGGVGLVCATIFCEPARNGRAGYRTADEARVQALAQMQWYQAQANDGRMAFVTERAAVGRVAENQGAAGPQAAILLMEGADPFRSVADVVEWFDAGLRIVGLAWMGTRMAGGTSEPGPLTAEGRGIVAALDARGIIHDASHLAEQSFWELLELTGGPVMASHSNCRSVVPTDRQLSDEMIRAIGRRGGVIGINFFEKFLVPPGEYRKRRATLADVVDHVRRMCDLIGDARHVGIGTDMDGGFGADDIPVEIRTSADLPKVAAALSAAGFGDADVAGVMGGNWVTFFGERLAG